MNKKNVKYFISNPSLRITLLYIIVSTIWILISDVALNSFVFNEDQLTVYQTIKGWFFVFITALLLYLLIYKYFSEIKKINNRLNISEERWKFALEGSNTGVWDYSLLDNQVYLSPRWKEIIGYKDDELKNEYNEWFNRIHPDDVNNVMEKFNAHIKRKTPVYEAEYRLKCKDGNYKWILDRGRVINYENNTAPLRMVGTHTDLTDIKIKEENINHLNKLYAFLTEVNQKVVRIKNEKELFESICKIAVTCGKFQLAWIGIKGNPKNLIIPVAAYGDEISFVNEINLNTAAAQKSDLHLKVLTDQKFLISNNIHKEKESFWREKAIEHGFKSSVSLQISKNGINIGSFNIYSNEYYFFNEDEVALLKEVTSDIIYAVEYIFREEQKRKSDDELKKSELKYRNLVEHASDGIFVADSNGKYIDVNSSGCTLLGYSKEEILNLSIKDLIPENEVEANPINYRNLQKDKTFLTERNLVKRDGTLIPVEISAKILDDGKMQGIVRDISARKYAEEVIKLSEQKYKYLFDYNPVPMWVVERFSFKFIDVNEAAIKKLEYSRDEFLNMNVFDIRIVAEGQDIKHLAYVNLNNQKISDVQYRKKNGLVIDFELVINDIEYQGKEARIVAAYDVTERKIAEKSLIESEERFRSLAYEAPFPILVHSEDGKILLINRSFVNVTEYNIEDIPTIFAWKKKIYINPNQIYEDKMYDGEFTITTKFGKTKILDIRSVPLGKLPDGRKIELSMAADLTERKNFETALLQSEAKFRAMVNSSPIGIFLISPEGKLTYSNNAFSIISGLSTDEAREFKWFSKIDPSKKDEIFNNWITAFKKQEAFYGITQFLLPGNNKVWVEIKTSKILAGDKIVGFIGLIIDITERMRWEEQISLSSEKLRALAAHLESIREEERIKISREIHDNLGQSLTGLKMDISWIQKRNKNNNSEIFNKLNSMSDEVSNTIQIVRKISSELRPSELDNLGIIAAIETSAREFEERTEIPCKIYTSIDDVSLNQQKSTIIFRILQEALTNIIRHAKANEVKINIKLANNNFVLNVEDDGIGIKNEQLLKSNSFGIMGMKERAYIVKGEVDISSLPQKGTRVKIVIPI